MACYEVARLFNSCNGSALCKSCIVEVRSCCKRNFCTCRDRRNKSCSPVCRLAGTEEDSLVDNLAERFLHARLNLCPDVVLSVIEYCLRNRNDDSDLFCIDHLLVPCLLGCLLLSGVAVYEVGNRKRVKHRELRLLCCHVCELASHREDCGALDCALDDLLGSVFRDERLCASSVNASRIVKDL